LLDISTIKTSTSLEEYIHREVVTEQLHDERAVLVRVLIQRIQLSDRIVKCLQQRTHGYSSAAIAFSYLKFDQNLLQGCKMVNF